MSLSPRRKVTSVFACTSGLPGSGGLSRAWSARFSALTPTEEVCCGLSTWAPRRTALSTTSRCACAPFVFFRWLGAQDVQVAGGRRASHRLLTVVNGMGSLDDGRAFALALDDGEQGNRDAPAGDQIAQDRAWAD